jgi:hypothetical protein
MDEEGRENDEEERKENAKQCNISKEGGVRSVAHPIDWVL